MFSNYKKLHKKWNDNETLQKTIDSGQKICYNNHS